MLDIIRALEQCGPLAHWTIVPGGPNPDLATPPMVWWTFAAPDEKKVAVLREAVDSFQGAVAWEFACVASSQNGARWKLAPARIRLCADLHGCQGDMLAAKALRVNDPGFGQRANADLPKLAAHVRDVLVKATGGGRLERASR